MHQAFGGILSSYKYILWSKFFYLIKKESSFVNSIIYFNVTFCRNLCYWGVHLYFKIMWLIEVQFVSCFNRHQIKGMMMVWCSHGSIEKFLHLIFQCMILRRLVWVSKINLFTFPVTLFQCYLTRINFYVKVTYFVLQEWVSKVKHLQVMVRIMVMETRVLHQ